MLHYKNLYILGTSHIAKQSVEEAEKVIMTQKPSVVALELDKGRFLALKTGNKRKPSLRDAKRYGFKGYLFAKLGEYVERKLGGVVNVSPGSDMMKAAEVASKEGLKVALVDQNIDITLKNFSKNFGWKEKFRFFWEILRNVVKPKKVSIDLRKVPSKKFIKEIMNKLKKGYPGAYKALVDDRNVYMAKKLIILMKKYPKVLAVVGAGHEEGLVKEVNKRFHMLEKI